MNNAQTTKTPKTLPSNRRGPRLKYGPGLMGLALTLTGGSYCKAGAIYHPLKEVLKAKPMTPAASKVA